MIFTIIQETLIEVATNDIFFYIYSVNSFLNIYVPSMLFYISFDINIKCLIQIYTRVFRFVKITSKMY